MLKLSQLLSQVQRLFVIVLAAFIISLSPAPLVFAESTSECSPPNYSTPGVHVPTGSDAAMYHYDCDQQLWVSAHYTYDPLTNTTSPLDAKVYTYNPSSGQWDYDMWVYVASKGNYALRSFSVATPPTGAVMIGGPVPTTPAATPTSSTATAQTPNSGVMTVADTSNGTATAVAVTNSVGSVATTGSATVFANTAAGNATTGNAIAIATLVNMLQSSGNTFGSDGNAVVFNTTISGDVTGDILLDPSLIGSIQPSSTPTSGLTGVNDVSHSDTSMTVTNNLSVGAASGDALVAANTTAGDATTGSATAIVNVLNFLNSTIVSGKSFLGVITIDGNLNGDILLPPNFIDELLASNVPTLSIIAPAGNNGKLDTSVSQSITNAVAATAESGNATVDKNTSAGNATSGNSTTNITTFNLTGSSVIGKNALLVFVNVLGTWYGLIFNAPAGATAASLGGTITTAAAGPAYTIGQYDTNQTITNNIVATAESGDATVTKNTNAGNAQTGDANVAVNILNIASSALSLSDWFGILFINVLGSWTGSFGIDTIAGTIVTPETNAPSVNGEASNTSNSQPAIFRFIPRNITGTILRGGPTTPTAADQQPSTDISETSVLAAQHITPSDKSASNSGENQRSVYWIYAVFIGAWIVLLAAERIYSKLRKH